MQVDIIAAGRLKRSAFSDLWDNYAKRMHWNIQMHEFDHQTKEKTDQKILSLLSNSAFIVALDERGKTYSSSEFAQKIKNLQNNSHNHLQFILGESEGLSTAIKEKANMLLSFGKQTWPHKLARIMLIEQLYRTQQILAGHPYHK